MSSLARTGLSSQPLICSDVIPWGLMLIRVAHFDNSYSINWNHGSFEFEDLICVHLRSSVISLGGGEGDEVVGPFAVGWVTGEEEDLVLLRQTAA